MIHCTGRTNNSTNMKGKNLVCRICSKVFYRIPAKIKRNKECFCSRECFDLSRVSRLEVVCQNCGKEFKRVKSQVVGKYLLCSRKCLSEIWKGVNHSGFFKKGNKKEKCINFKDGTQEANGYIMDLSPDHPFANKRGYVYQHRIIMEKKIGRFLSPEEVVHHIDKNKKNNEPENLYLFENIGAHTTFHLLERYKKV